MDTQQPPVPAPSPAPAPASASTSAGSSQRKRSKPKTAGVFVATLFLAWIPFIVLDVLMVKNGTTLTELDSINRTETVIVCFVAFLVARRYWRTGSLRQTVGLPPSEAPQPGHQAIETDEKDDTTVDREGPGLPAVVEGSSQPTIGAKGTTRIKALPIVGVVVLVILALGGIAYGVDQHNDLSHVQDDLTASKSAARADHVRMQDTQNDLSRSLDQVRSELNKTKAKLRTADDCMRGLLRMLDFAVSNNWSAYTRFQKSVDSDCREAGL